jgi:hypothetical protein
MVGLGFFSFHKQIRDLSTHYSVGTGGSFFKGVVLGLKISQSVPCLSMLWCV